MARFLLIRHGATAAIGHNLSGRTPGVPLTAEGLAQASALGAYLKDCRPLHQVVSSPLERTLATAYEVAGPQGLPVSVDERFTEFDFGQWTGWTFDRLDADPAWLQYNKHRSLYGAPGGESLADVQRRAWAGLQSLASAARDETIAIVSHADVIRALLMLVLAMPLDYILRLNIPLASVSECRVGTGDDLVVSSIGLTVNCLSC